MKQALLPFLILTLLLSVSVWADEDDVETQSEDAYNEIGFGSACSTMTEMCSPDMFCAADGVCHLRTCENFYLYAPEVWTGRHHVDAQTTTTTKTTNQDEDNDEDNNDEDDKDTEDNNEVDDTEDHTEDHNDTEDNNEEDDIEDNNNKEIDNNNEENNKVDDNEDEETIERGELECYINEFPNTVEPPCRDHEGRPLFPIAVHYSCHVDSTSTHSGGIQCPEWDDVESDQNGSGATRQFATANRVCTAKPNSEQRFVCYDMAPDTNLASYFETYGAAIESCDECQDDAHSTGNMSCGTNGHQITSHLTATTSSGSIGDNTFLPGVDGNLGESFDPSLVGTRSINTMLISDPSTTNGTSTNGTGELGSSSPQRIWSLLSRIVSIVSVSMTIVGW